MDPDDPAREPVSLADVGLWGDWSPDGRQILYTGLTEAGEEGALWVVNSDGTGAHMLDLPNVRGAYESSWGPDGRSRSSPHRDLPTPRTPWRRTRTSG